MNEDELKKAEEQANSDKGTSVKLFVLDNLPRIKELLRKLWKSKLLSTLISPVKKEPLLFIIVLANIWLVWLNLQSNERQEKLFIGQNKPLIDVTPIGITQDESTGTKMALTIFSVVNYSGFVANNIAIDVSYDGNFWISEWKKAENDKIEKEKRNTKEDGVRSQSYLSSPKVLITELKPGKTEDTDIKCQYALIAGSLDLEEQVSGKEKEGVIVLVRVRWENVVGHVFDEIHKYRLISTKVESGRAFTFIPEGIISQKN